MPSTESNCPQFSVDRWTASQTIIGNPRPVLPVVRSEPSLTIDQEAVNPLWIYTFTLQASLFCYLVRIHMCCVLSKKERNEKKEIRFTLKRCKCNLGTVEGIKRALSLYVLLTTHTHSRPMMVTMWN